MNEAEKCTTEKDSSVSGRGLVALDRLGWHGRPRGAEKKPSGAGRSLVALVDWSWHGRQREAEIETTLYRSNRYSSLSKTRFPLEVLIN
jgi:hypothetical protein